MEWLATLGILIFPIPIIFRINRLIEYVVERRRQKRKVRIKLVLLRNSKNNRQDDVLISVAFYIGIIPLAINSYLEWYLVTVTLAIMIFLVGLRVKYSAVKAIYVANGVE